MPHLLFDLDNTLYPATAGVTEALEAKMNAYVAALTGLTLPDAARLRQGYFVRYGTTLRGLQLHHAVDSEAYLAAVHDIPIEQLVTPDRMLVQTLSDTPHQRAIFTNSPREHATRVLGALGLGQISMPIVDIRAIGFEPKPSRAAYDRALELTRWQPADTVFFEDTLVNLCTAKACGMQTVYIAPASNRETVPEYVDAVYPDVVSAILAMTR